MKTKGNQPETTDAPNEKTMVEYNNAFVLKGNNLQPLITDPETSAKIAQDKQSLEKKFKNETELAEIVLNNGKILFGESTILIDCLMKNSIVLSNGFIPDGLLFDLRESEKPRFYFIEINLSKENLGDLLLRITRLFSFVRTKENISQFTVLLSDIIRKNIGLRNKLKTAFGDKGVYDYLRELFTRQPEILLVMDNPIQELEGFIETYSWGNYLKQMFVRKFAIDGETIFTMSPTFVELTNKKNGKKVKVKSSEEDHLENVSETVKEIFLQIKAELLETDPTIEFRVKQYYISLRKNRNISFFQLGKKRLSIVIANPEKTADKLIKHNKIFKLSDSVRKFWNGNEHCFTVVIENKEHLSEVTSLLKKLIPSEKQEKRDQTPALKETSVKDKSQAKPKRKGKK